MSCFSVCYKGNSATYWRGVHLHLCCVKNQIKQHSVILPTLTWIYTISFTSKCWVTLFMFFRGLNTDCPLYPALYLAILRHFLKTGQWRQQTGRREKGDCGVGARVSRDPLNRSYASLNLTIWWGQRSSMTVKPSNTAESCERVAWRLRLTARTL